MAVETCRRHNAPQRIGNRHEGVRWGGLGRNSQAFLNGEAFHLISFVFFLTAKNRKRNRSKNKQIASWHLCFHSLMFYKCIKALCSLVFKKILLFKGSLCKCLLKEVFRVLLVYQIPHYRPAAEMCMGRMREAPYLGETPMAVTL